MSKTAKYVITIAVILVALALFVVVCGIRGDAGFSGPGILGLIICCGAIGAVRGVWKK